MATMAQSDLQKARFQERLERIRCGGPNCMGALHVGPVEEELVRQKGGAPAKAKAKVKTVRLNPGILVNMLYPLGILGVFLAGMAAVFAARYVRYHLMGAGLAGEDPDLSMMIDAGFAMVVMVFIRLLLNTRGQEMATAKTAGIAVMICAMHNLVHWSPASFETLFSPAWVEETLWTTEPNSILFRGASFVVSPPAPEATGELPTILELDAEF